MDEAVVSVATPKESRAARGADQYNGHVADRKQDNLVSKVQVLAIALPFASRPFSGSDFVKPGGELDIGAH